MRIYLPVVLLLSAACAPPTTVPGTPPVDTDVPTPEPVDCSIAPDVYEVGPLLEAPRANRSITIDGERMVGWDAPSLIEATSPTEASVFVPQITAYGGMAFLDDGRFVVSEHLGNENVLMIPPGGGQTVLASGLRAYGLILDAEERIYAVSAYDAIYRFTADDPTLETWLELDPTVLPRLADFSPGMERFYLGTRDEAGTIWAVDLDDDQNPVGEPWVFANTPGWFHDMLVVDACGNLYVTAFHGSDVYRITPDGEVIVLATLAPEQHVHGGAWGEGIGAWDDRTLYVTHPNLENRVSAWSLGIPARPLE